MKTLSITGLLVLVAVASRLLPHPANMTPVAALALLFVSQWKQGPSRYAFAMPLLAVFISDLVLGFYPGIEFVYLGHILAATLGVFLMPWNFKKLIGISTASSLVFFVVSNFGVWISSTLYPRNFEGLMACYSAALPFLRNSVCADLIFSVAIFSLVRFVANQSPKLAIVR